MIGKSTHVQLHSVACQLHVDVVELEERLVDVCEDLIDAVVRFQERMYIGLELAPPILD